MPRRKKQPDIAPENLFKLLNIASNAQVAVGDEEYIKNELKWYRDNRFDIGEFALQTAFGTIYGAQLEEWCKKKLT